MVLSMDRWKGKIAVVTGASAGIGAAICEKLVEEGLLVVGVARREERVIELANRLSHKQGKLYAYKADISKEDEIIRTFEWIKQNLGPVHILINNAGIARNTTLTCGNTEMWREVLDVNVLSLCIATREAFKQMSENNIDGHIIHLNSIAGHKVPYIPSFNIYPASKFAVTALTESLRVELNSIKSKIKITSISPGATDTEFNKASDTDMNDEYIALAFQTALKAEDVADAILYALSTPPHVQVHELTIKPILEAF